MKKILVTIPVREKDRKFLEEKGKEFQFCYRTKGNNRLRCGGCGDHSGKYPCRAGP